MGAQAMGPTGLTNNQHLFAEYLAALWGKLEVAAESRDFPSDEDAASHSVPSAKYAGRVELLHGYRISQSRHWKLGARALASPSSTGGATHFRKHFSTTPGLRTLSRTPSSTSLLAYGKHLQ